MLVHSLFLSDYAPFQLTFKSLVSTSRACRIWVCSYQLHCLLVGLFGTTQSFQRSSNLVRIFLHQGYDLATLVAIHGCNNIRFSNQYPCTASFPGAFQLGIFLHSIFTISWLISTFSILLTFSNCFLQPFNYSVCWLCHFVMLQISLQNLILSSEFGIILPPCFSPFRSLYTSFWLT